MPLQVELVSPERILFTGEADDGRRAHDGGGDIAFLPGHVPFIGTLDVYPVEDLRRGRRASRSSPCTAASSRSPTTTCRSSPTWPSWPATSTCPGPRPPGPTPRSACASTPSDEAAKADLERAEVRLLVAGGTLVAGH